MSEVLEPTRKTRYSDGETVYVPASVFPDPASTEFALVKSKVLGSEGRSVFVDVPGSNGETQLVATSKIHSSSLGLLVLSVGDIVSENALIEPLHKSMLQFMRLLLPDDMVRSWRVRTTTELTELWNANDVWKTFSHVVIVSHAGRDGLKFLDQVSPVGGDALGDIMKIDKNASAKVFLSLACESGKAGFAKAFSKTKVCRELLAPFQTIHGASACQYAQSLLAHHLLDGVTMPIAKRRADESRTSGIHFRRWVAGTFS